ncbi:C-signal-like [Asterias amurensis]|uniref:C-signal-like n=1 Tax=Asterias amurensis TaxID=7602 RepID=UPI003AB16738
MFSVLVTGANRGIGLAFVRQLLSSAKPPVNIFACCRTPENAVELQSIANSNSSVTVLKLDLSDKLTYEDAVKRVEPVVGEQGLSLLINNAGVDSFGINVENTSAEEAERVFKVNVTGTLGVTLAFLPSLRRSAKFTCSDEDTMSIEKSAIVNITSHLGSISLHKDKNITNTPYKVSKAALNMLTNCMSIDFAADGILAVAMSPGWVQTDMGGKDEAPLTPKESVCGMLATLDKLKGLEASGKCHGYNGDILSW